LIERLTGIHPDRLREEQEREMTIDLGFAWMTLPGGEEIGIIDVPGHRDFIENMLAGVGGIDAALFVIAGDEGVMPQTREHLAILDLLEVPHCIVALTKIDLVEDREWLQLVKDDAETLFKETRFRGAEIVEVSAISGEGIDDLKNAIERTLVASTPRLDLGRPRLPIDRAFTIAGFGTVVTGTLIDGHLEIGNEILVLPAGLKGRIRGLQTHKTQVEKAIPGSRVAANLASVDVNRVVRGDVVCIKGDFEQTNILDASVRLLRDAPGVMKHNQQVKVFLGTAQRVARVRLLGTERLSPGEEGWIQLVFEDPVIAARGDRFILRRPSPGATIGGGRVADAHPVRRYRRMDPDSIKRLEGLMAGGSDEILRQTILECGIIPIKEAVSRAGLDREQAKEGLGKLIEKGEIISMEEGNIDVDEETLVIERSTLRAWLGKMTRELERFHTQYPLRPGMPREELKSRMKIGSRDYSLLLEHAVKEESVQIEGYRVRNFQHEPRLNDVQTKNWEELKERFQTSGYAPPSVKECIQSVGEEVMGYLLSQGELIKLSESVVFEVNDYRKMVDAIRDTLSVKDELTVAEVRDIFGTSRKYALALMEHLDEIGVTKREGDGHRLA
jgi:selenocysteine-specific elongation factor